ncbi:MAG TPA: RHS repeat-associated core domain-containing protein [Chthoniobacterales bacterium]|nr:RHS repeat-associated core domain-containing protein [Chthoniobacterales bacterium]
MAVAPTAKADVACYAHKSTNCGVFLAWDGVVLDDITINVAPGVPSGRYSAGLLATNSAWLQGYYEMVVVNVNPDGTWSGGLSPGAGVSYGNGVNGWQFYSVTVGGTAVTVTGDLPYLGGYPCDGNTAGNVQHGKIQITIGTPPPPCLPRDPYPTCDAPKIGGNAPTCSSCGGAGGSDSKSTLPSMAQYRIHSRLVSLNIQGRPLRYSSAYGPSVDFTVTYNQRDNEQPATFSYSNLGPKWTFGWLSYVTDSPSSQLALTPVYRSGGGAEVFAYDAISQSFINDARSHAALVKTGPASYERRLPDGSKEVFGLSNGASSYPRRVFMTQIVDPAGNTTNIGYDASFRVTTITDALNQVTTVSYELAGDPLKVTKVTDPFGRFATFEYTNGKLTRITDEIGIQSQFTYAAGTDSVDSLTTPYGTTTFVTGENGTNRWIEATDPLGKERVEYRDNAPGITASDSAAPAASGITNAGLDVANTFYWDKKAMQVAPGDYTKAQVIHWLYQDECSVSDVISSEKMPLENRLWYTYPGQPDYQHVGTSTNPSQTARVLGDGTTQLNQFEYNSIGKTTKTTDPVGRVMSYIYGTNNIDLLEIRQTRGTNNELQRKFTYNTLHEPLTDADAAGQVTTFTYNAQGQMLTRANAKNETTTYAYGGTVPTGCLASITSPAFNGASAVTTFIYDSFKRVRTITDSDGYAISTDYDNLDRKTKVTFPDTTYEEFRYTDNGTGVMKLDLTASRDRRGRWTYRHYNANQKMDSITDPANRTTLYGWCNCGALTSITDPKNQTTAFNRDLQSRVYEKVFQDGTKITYLYEGQTASNIVGATSRLKSFTDGKNQRTNYSYFADNTLQGVNYTDTAGQSLSPSTPSVTYAYDPNYKRVSTMTDGTGVTNYVYNPITVPPGLGAGQLGSIDGPLANDTVVFGYDELGRTLNQSINGAANPMAVTFDTLGRVQTETNNLGTFDPTYVGVTNRVQTLAYPNGQSTVFAYLVNGGDKQLQTLQNLRPNASSLSKFDYVYDAGHMITRWAKQNDSAATEYLYLTYDPTDQLVQWSNVQSFRWGGITQTYEYDPAGNRLVDDYNIVGAFGEGGGEDRKDATFNNLNELIAVTGYGFQQAGGPGPIVWPGEEPPAPQSDAYSYDLNGNLIARTYWQGGGNTFEWDAANRLIAITYTGNSNRTELTYDGASHCTKIVEKAGTTVTSTKQFVWLGHQIAEERDANNVTTRRYYSDGEQRIGGSDAGIYYYSKDHLGSIREMTDVAGTLRARYNYDPFGNWDKVSGDLNVDFGYTGHFRHSASHLYFAPFRTYDPTIGRWINRDPIGEGGGLNLYSYVGNSPNNRVDPLGLIETWPGPASREINTLPKLPVIGIPGRKVHPPFVPDMMLPSGGCGVAYEAWSRFLEMAGQH